MRVHAEWADARAIVASSAVVFALVVAACSGAASQAGATGATAEAGANPATPTLAPPSPTLAPMAASPAPSEEPLSLIAQLSAQGMYCIECQLFWDPIARSLVPPPSASTDPSAAPAEPRTWREIRLTTARGAGISLADFAGRPVIVEMMATWCASCAEQQDTLREARPGLPPDTVIVSLSVDPRDDAATLARYAADHGYDWDFATGPVDLLRSLAGQLGDAALNPVATPIVVIDRSGKVTLAPVGHKDVAAITALVGS